MRELLTGQGQDADNFAAEFDHWKSLGERGEYSAYLFGKDAAYRLPPVNGDHNVLRHVHLVPLKDPAQIARWDLAWQRRSRKTSDRALVYVSDPRQGHLLLFILEEPAAHAVARMLLPEHRQLMQMFAVVAERFIHDGEVIA